MFNRRDLNCKYLGLHSCRYQAAALHEKTFYFTQGGYIAKMNLPSLHPCTLFKTHNSMISCLSLYPRDSPIGFLTVDYYGCIAIHSWEGKLLAQNKEAHTSVIPKGVRTASLSLDSSLLAVLSIGGNPHNGTIEVYSLETLQLVRKFVGNFKQCEFLNSSDLFVLRENIVDPGEIKVLKQRDRPIVFEKVLDDFEEEEDEILDSEELLNNYIYHSKRLVTYYACLFYNVKNERRGKAELMDIYSRVNCMQQNYKGLVAFATISRVVHVMDMERLQILHVITLKGSGILATVMFLDNTLYFSPQVNYLCKFNCSQPNIKTEVNISEANFFVDIVKTSENWVHKNNFLCWIEQDKQLLSLNEYGVFLGTFLMFPESGEMTEVLEESIFKMTCCGLDIHPELDLVAVGDFSGKVAIFDYQDNLLVSSTSVYFSIRSLSWHQDQVFIGTLDGQLYTWDFQSSDPILFHSFPTTIVCMSWKNEILSLGCTSGELFFLNSTQIISSIMAHERQESVEEFGSLGLFSEIWSLSWSPGGDRIASGSEDQSVKIWSYPSLSCIVTLPKHRRAVTGVRWEAVSFKSGTEEYSEILVTCSDDESLRVYDPRTWNVIYTLFTSVIQEWHTVTYTSIEKGGSHVACVTQNGFVFVLDLKEMNCSIVERIHNGSIEGLDWKKQLITCSSEGLCCVISMN